MRRIVRAFQQLAVTRPARFFLRALAAPLLPLRARYQPRRFHAYCIGSVKSGTHSIAGMFASHYRAAHEAESAEFIDAIIASSRGILPASTCQRFLKQRDLRLWLELEASHLLAYLLPELLETFPDARYILTIRDCYSWLDSYINQLYYRGNGAHWKRFSEWRYPAEQHLYAPEEKILAAHGLCPLDLYLALWKEHNEHVLRLVPAERLLIIRTHEILDSAPQLAEFLDIPVKHLDVSRGHSYQARGKSNVLYQIDRDFLAHRFQRHCQEFMSRFFPEFTFEQWHAKMLRSLDNG